MKDSQRKAMFAQMNSQRPTQNKSSPFPRKGVDNIKGKYIWYSKDGVVHQTNNLMVATLQAKLRKGRVDQWITRDEADGYRTIKNYQK